MCLVSSWSAKRKFRLRTLSPKSTIYFSSGLPATNLPLLPRLLQLPVALRMDLLLTAGEHVLRRDVTRGVVQADVVVVVHVSAYQTPRILQRQWRSRSDALSFQRFVPTFDFSVRLGIVGRSSDVGHARDTNEFLEVFGNELRPVIGDDPGPYFRVKFLGALQDDLDVRLGHRLPQIPVHYVATAAVQNAAQVVERPADVDVRHVDMPVLMRCQRLLKARAFLRRLAVPLGQQSRLPQHAPYAGRTHRHDVCVEHHERQAAVALQRVLEMKADDGLLLPILQPEVAGNPAIVLVRLPVAFPPVLELAGGAIEPHNEPPGADLGLLRPAPDEIHDLIPRIVRNPAPGQSSPLSFISATCSAINSARTSSFVWIFCCRYAIRSWSAEWLVGRFCSKAAAPFSKNSFCQR